MRDAVISCCAIVLVVGAFDDITTDDARHFTVEYCALVLSSMWFAYIAVRLTRLGYRTLGILSFVSLAAGAWGQSRLDRNIVPSRSVPYLITVVAIFWFVALSIFLLYLGSRGLMHRRRR